MHIPPIILKVKALLLKLLPESKKRMEQNYEGYKLLRAVNQTSLTDQFDSIYNEALLNFEQSNPKHSLLIDLLKKSSSKQAFKDDFYNATNSKFENSLEADLNVEEKYLVLKNANIDLKKEINEFIISFIEKLNQAKSPVAKELSDKVDELSGIILSSIDLSKASFDISDHIAQITSLRNENKHDAVLQLLKSFKDKKWNSLSNELKHKVTLNIGATYFELDNKKEGAKYFIELLDYEVKIAESYGFAALGYSLLRDNENAVKYANKALQLDKDNENAYLALIFSNEETLEVKDLDALIPIEIQKLPGIAINIGSLMDRRGKLDEAFLIFQDLEKNHPKFDAFKCDILVLLATNRIKSIEHSEDFIFGQLSENSVEKSRYALEKLNEAWEHVKNTDLRYSRAYILTNRGVANKILNNLQGAESDFKASLELNKTYFSYRHLLILNTDNQLEFSKILSEIETLTLTTTQKQEIQLFRIMGDVKSPNFSEEFDKLKNDLPNVTSKQLQLEYYSAICDILLIQNNINESEKYGLEFVELNPNDPQGYCTLYQIYNKKGSPETADSYLLEAKKLIKPDTSRLISVQIAETFTSKGDLTSAIEIFENIANLETPSKITKKLLQLYFKNGNFKSASDIINKLLKKYNTDPYLVDMLSAIYESSGQFDNAIQAINDYLQFDPGNKFMKYKLAMNYYKKSEFTLAFNVLDTIVDYTDIPLDPQFMIADTYIKAGKYDRGFEIAYQIRSANYSNPSVHARYVQLLTTNPDLGAAHYFPTTISDNCFVGLTDEMAKPLSFIIVPEPKIQNEIANTEPLALKLIGKQIGDTVDIGDGLYTINSIMTKYTHALHNSTELLETRFRDQTPIKVMKLKPGGVSKENLSKMLAPIDKAISFDNEMEKLYKQGESTIGVNASISGLNPIKYWSKLVANPDIGIHAIGPIAESQIAMSQLEIGKDLILDITALLALSQLNVLPVLSKIKNKKYVTQSTVDLITQEIQETNERINEDTTMVDKFEGQYIKYAITSEQKKNNINNLNIFWNQINEHTEIIEPPVNNNFNDKQQKDKVLGKSFNETAMIAGANNLVILSDDLYFRNLARNEFKVSGVSTINFLGYLGFKGHLSNDEILEYLLKLIKLNYRFVPSSEKILLRICQENDFTLKQPFQNACDVIDTRFLSDIEAIKLVGRFLFLLYTNTALQQTRIYILQFILHKLFTGRKSSYIKGILIPFIDTLFKFLPLEKDEIINTIIQQF